MENQINQTRSQLIKALNGTGVMPKRSRIFPWMISMSVAALLVGLFGLNLFVQSYIEQSEAKMLNQTNMSMSQEMESQQGVLKFIAEDFSVLERTLEFSEGEFDGLFDEIELAESGIEIEEDGTLDIMILGNNGAHTDTIMIVSVNGDKEKVTIFSIPRDLYVNGRRINEYYYYYGIDQLESMVESVIGLTIDQYVQIDLDAFVEVVDAIGGVDVYVEEALYDGLYPNGKGGYMAYSIDAGSHHFDGESALKYARSRHSTSDFDRAERQQKIMDAVRVKLLQMDTMMDMKALTSLFRTAMDHVNTDIKLFDLVAYYYDYKSYEVDSGFVLTSGNYLYSYISPDSGAYVLLPREGNFEEIHGVIAELVN